MGALKEKATPELSDVEENQRLMDRTRARIEKGDEMQETIRRNRETKRPDVRRGGGRRKRKTRRKIIKRREGQ